MQKILWLVKGLDPSSRGYDMQATPIREDASRADALLRAGDWR
jgi:hypothetical protein